MRELLGALLGVPAAIAISGGIGLVGVTLWLRVRPRPGQPPVRWAHLLLGLAMFGAGAALLGIDITVIGLS